LSTRSTDEQTPATTAVVTLDEAFVYAQSRHQAGFVKQAVRIYEQILSADPEHVNAIHFLGVAAFQLGKPKDAIGLIERALELDPSCLDAYNNLGNVLQRQGDLERARACYQRVLDARPDSPEPLINLGVVLRAERRLDEAKEIFERVIAISPSHFEAHHNLGNVLLCMNQDGEALDAFRAALMLRPYDRNAYRRLAAAYYSLGRIQQAADVYRRWLEIAPDDPEARHMVAACTGDAVPPRATGAVIQVMFDQFAGSFDVVLHRLEYKAPALVGEALASTLGPARATSTVLDAGCGTGLGAPLLRPYARRLVGADLSPRMVELAAERGLYDDLVVCDITDYAAEREGVYHLIVAIDTLVYFGDLTPVIRAFARGLEPGGDVVFTVEQGRSDGPDGYRIHPHGRYSHTEPYVNGVVAECELDLVSLRSGVLRNEAGKPVDGYVVVCRKPIRPPPA
jgi:predicted TPR repeat methyltransferase